jgi:hypothetical protein
MFRFIGPYIEEDKAVGKRGLVRFPHWVIRVINLHWLVTDTVPRGLLEMLIVSGKRRFRYKGIG